MFKYLERCCWGCVWICPVEMHWALLWIGERNERKVHQSDRNPFQLDKQISGTGFRILDLYLVDFQFKNVKYATNECVTLTALTLLIKYISSLSGDYLMLACIGSCRCTRTHMVTQSLNTCWWWKEPQRESWTAVLLYWSKARSNLWMMNWKKPFRMLIWSSGDSEKEF